MNSQSITTASSIVGAALATFEFAVSPTTAIPVNGYIKVTFDSAFTIGTGSAAGC